MFKSEGIRGLLPILIMHGIVFWRREGLLERGGGKGERGKGEGVHGWMGDLS